jgi:hypothetical protein
MHDELTKAQLLDALREEWRRWEAVLAQVGDAWMTVPLPASGWSIKDILAHVTWYEQQMVAVLQPHSGPGPARDWLWEFTADKRNAILFTAQQDRLLADVRAEAQQVHAQLVAAVQGLTAANVREPQRFPDMPRGWQPWQSIARHSYQHYQEHIPGIQTWLNTPGPAPVQGLFVSPD